MRLFKGLIAIKSSDFTVRERENKLVGSFFRVLLTALVTLRKNEPVIRKRNTSADENSENWSRNQISNFLHKSVPVMPPPTNTQQTINSQKICYFWKRKLNWESKQILFLEKDNLVTCVWAKAAALFWNSNNNNIKQYDNKNEEERERRET